MPSSVQTTPVVIAELPVGLAEWVEAVQEQTPLAIPRALEHFRRYYELRRALFDVLRSLETPQGDKDVSIWGVRVSGGAAQR